MTAAMMCGWDGVCKLQMNEKGDAWVTLSAVAAAATGVAPNTSYTFIPRTHDPTLVGHLYQKLIVRTYEGQDLIIGGRTAELYTISLAA